MCRVAVEFGHAFAGLPVQYYGMFLGVAFPPHKSTRWFILTALNTNVNVKKYAPFL